MLEKVLEELQRNPQKAVERAAANRLRKAIVGFGPKQSRNFLQWLGLTRYEIPLDSRVARWFNEFGFPVKVSGPALSDPEYYEFVLDGIQELCSKADILPCELDAMIFAEREPTDWDGESRAASAS